MSAFGQKRKWPRQNGMSVVPSRVRPSPHVRFVPILLQKSFWGGERKFLEPLMRLTRGDVRDHIVSPKIHHGSP
jgi:hypothetical protein